MPFDAGAVQHFRGVVSSPDSPIARQELAFKIKPRMGSVGKRS